jgi:hypothetical protein
MNTGLCQFDQVNTESSVTESEEERSPKKSVAPVNGKVAKKPPAK